MKDKNTEKAASGGMGLCGVLTTIFVVIKLIGVIDWPWVWVLSPLWIGFLASCLIIAIIIAIGVWIFRKEDFGRW
jgi:predicted membrane protein